MVLENIRCWYWTSDTRINSIVVGNVDDGGPEIVTGGYYSDGTRNVGQLCVWTGATLSLVNVKVWCWTGNTEIRSVAVGNVDSDAQVEIVTGGYYYDGTRSVAQICVWNGATLTLENSQTWYWTSNTVIHSITAYDVDGDSKMEIVAGGNYYDGARDNAQLVVWAW